MAATTETTEGKGLLESTVAGSGTPGELSAQGDGTVYVVQVLEEHELEIGVAHDEPGDEGRPETEVFELWRDIGTVTLPKRGRRNAAVKKALELPENEALRPTGLETRKFRALDVDSAEIIPAGVKVHEELVVG